MNNEDAAKIRNAAKRAAIRMGFGYAAEDLAQDAMERIIKNPKKWPRFAVIEAIKADIGDNRMRTPGTRGKYGRNKRSTQPHVELPPHLAAEEATQHVPGYGDLTPDQVRILLTAELPRMEHAAFMLVHGWGLAVSEIAVALGVDERAVSMALTLATDAISKAAK